MIPSASPFGKAGLFVVSGALFLVVLFLKLCYSTALYATLAEVNRRVTLFRQNRKPVLRAVLLLPSVVLFCSAVLFVLCLPFVVLGGMRFQLMGNDGLQQVAFAFLRIGFILAAIVLGAALGIIVGRNVPTGRDRFGGLLYANRGRYLAFWLFSFSACGFFRLMPWGFITYWTVWLLVLAACLVTAAHWTLYGALRSRLASPAPGLPPGVPARFSLDAPEAVVLSVLLRQRGAVGADVLGRSLAEPDAAWLAHPAWEMARRDMSARRDPLDAALKSLEGKGLAGSQGGWRAAGAAARLGALGFVETSAALTVSEGGTSRTVVLHRKGPTAILVEPGPATLSVTELEPGADPGEALASAVSR